MLTLTESVRSHLAITMERDSLKEQLDDMKSQKENLLENIAKLEVTISQLETEVTAVIFEYKFIKIFIFKLI